jgi:hypothetical protein
MAALTPARRKRKATVLESKPPLTQMPTTSPFSTCVGAQTMGIFFNGKGELYVI